MLGAVERVAQATAPQFRRLDLTACALETLPALRGGGAEERSSYAEEVRMCWGGGKSDVRSLDLVRKSVTWREESGHD